MCYARPMKLAGRHNKAPYMEHARKNGWQLAYTGKGHVRATRTIDGVHHMLFLSGTPGGGRAKENCLAKFIRCEKGRCHCHLRHTSLSDVG